MMVVDASVLTAILLEEPEAGELVERPEAAETTVTHPVSVYETVTALARERHGDFARATSVVTSFLLKTRTHSVEIGGSETMAAIEAFARYGRGRHPAKLNMGDCFSYAVAKVRGVPLLYKGDDFAKTDLA